MTCPQVGEFEQMNDETHLLSNPIAPDEGWRLIDKKKDKKEPGDEYLDSQMGWRPAGCNIGFLDGHTYRRRIEQERLEPKMNSSSDLELKVSHLESENAKLREALKRARKLAKVDGYTSRDFAAFIEITPTQLSAWTDDIPARKPDFKD